MPRKARSIHKGEYYHIISRGNNRQLLFRGTEDFQFYLALFLRYKQKFKVSLIHYCLMSNHTHMLMKCEETANGITKTMHGVQMVYARYYKKKYRRTGHVFEDRFKHFHIETEAHLLECGRYIERNPVRAEMVKEASEYPWSSYRYYGLRKANDLLTENPLYSGLGTIDEERRKTYQAYVQTTRAYESIVDQYFKERVLV